MREVERFLRGAGIAAGSAGSAGAEVAAGAAGSLSIGDQTENSMRMVAVMAPHGTGRTSFLNAVCRHLFSSKQVCGVFKSSIKAADMVTSFSAWTPILSAMLRAIELSDGGDHIDLKCGSVGFTRVVLAMQAASEGAIAMLAASLFPHALSAEDAQIVSKMSGDQKLQFAVEGFMKAVAAAAAVIRRRHAELQRDAATPAAADASSSSSVPSIVVLM